MFRLTKTGIGLQRSTKSARVGHDQQRRRATDKPPTRARIQQLYVKPQAFTQLLPWLDYDPQQQCFLLDDGYSVAALFAIEPMATEGRTDAFLMDLRDKLQTVLTSLPEEPGGNPWILQFYLQDEPQLSDMADTISRYVKDRARESELTATYLMTLQAHFQAISKPGGLFNDQAVTGSAWRGQDRKIRATLYRRRNHSVTGQGGMRLSPEQELNEVAGKLMASLNAAGIRIKRCDGNVLYDWLFRWFNPAPATTEGNVEQLLKMTPYPGHEDLPFGHDFSEMLMLGTPLSDKDTGLWWFDGLPHKVVTVQALRRVPSIGLLSSERSVGDHIFATFDRAPENTIFVMTLVMRAQDEIRNHLAAIQHAAVGDNPEAILAGRDAEAAQMEMAKGNKLYPVQMAFFMRGESEADLRQKINRLNSLLLANNIQPILERDDLISLDSYIRNLPMAYDFGLDKTESRRSRLLFSKHAANLMPLYGRSTGTGHPGILLYNRGAEPLTFDPLNIMDRKKNGHALIVGPTGSGKSALLVYFILQLMAIYRPRVFIIEAGNSFGLLGDYLKAHQVSVNSISLTPNADVSLPPFGDALKLLDRFNQRARREQRKMLQDEALLRELAAALDDDLDGEAQDTEEDNDDSGRDMLGEMEIAARIMITGGDVREDNRLTRADRLLIRHAIYQAARHVQESGRSQVLTEDVVNALRQLPNLADRRLERAQDMADGMALFCDGLAGHFFNRPGIRWPDVDVTIVDMGILAREGYDDQLTVAYIGLMNHIHDLVEQQQHDHRPTLVITDEGHIITTNPLLAPYVIKIVKMWRKLGAWFWIATQSLEDFPDASRKMLSMLEWWFCLVMPKDEIEQIARFKDLNAEQKALLLAAKKSPGHYTEGVALTDELTVLFRNVPPALALALAMTEKDEKARRKDLMKQHQCSELDAVHLVAIDIAQKRGRQS